jgi:hypothetical protein
MFGDQKKLSLRDVILFKYHWLREVSWEMIDKGAVERWEMGALAPVMPLQGCHIVGTFERYLHFLLSSTKNRFTKIFLSRASE